MLGETPMRDPGSRLPRFLDLLLVVLVALAIYWPSLQSPFVFDDLQIIVGNTHVHEGDIGTILGSGYWDGYDELLGEQQALYRPLTVLSYALNWAMGAEDPAGYRLLNVVLHALTALLVLGLLRRLLRSRMGALAGALLFVAHPIQTEAVTYIAGRADVLAALFFFGAWLAFMAFGKQTGWLRRALYGASLALFGMGLLSKEMAATLPAVLMLFDLLSNMQAGCSLRSGMVNLAKRWRLYGGYFLVLGGFLALRGVVLGAVIPAAGMIKERANPVAGMSILERFDDAVAILGRELALLIYPHPLSVDYSLGAIPVSKDLLSAGAMPFFVLAVVVMLFALGGLLRRRGLMLVGAVLYFFGTLFPVSNLAFIIGTNFGERMLYLVSFAAALALGECVRWSVARGGKVRASAVALSLAVTLVAAWGTQVRNLDYQSGYRLFQAAKQAYPSASRAQFNFGVYAAERGDELVLAGQGDQAQAEYDLALQAYKRTIEIDPSYLEASFELGRFAQQRGDAAAAADFYQVILESGAEVQNFPDAVTGFADSCLARGEAERGRRVLRQSVRGWESLRFPYELALGLLEVALQDDHAARTHFEGVLALPVPEDEVLRVQRVRVLTELARVEARLGNDLRAIELFDQAVKDGAQSLGPHLYRIEYHRDAHRFDAAERSIHQALLLFPGHYLLSAERGHLARARGDFKTAQGYFKAALAAQPRHQASRTGIMEMGLEQLKFAREFEGLAQDGFGQFVAAEALLRSALAHGARRPGLQFEFFDCLRALGRWGEASSGFEAIAQKGGPRAAEASVAFGRCQMALGHPEVARNAFERALSLKPGSESARAALVQLDSQAARPAPGVTGQAFEQLVRSAGEAQPGTWAFLRLHRSLASSYTLAGRDDEAKRTLALIRLWAPEDPPR